MAPRGRVPLCMILLVAAFATVGLVGFQTLKERRNASVLLAAKDAEIDHLKNGYEKELQTTKKDLLRVTEEKDKLSYQVAELGHIKDEFEASKKHLAACKQEKEKGAKEKDGEVRALKEELHAKDTEILTAKAKLEQAKLKSQKIGGIPDVISANEKDEKDELSREGLDLVTKKSKDTADEDSEDTVSRKAAEQEEKQRDNSENLADDRNAASEAEIEDAKADADLEDSKANTADLEESELAATKAVGAEDDDSKELEADVKLAASDAAVETNESLAQE